MTTIVWDGRQLASDSQLTINWNVISQEPFAKLHLLSGDFINPETKETDQLLGMGLAGDPAQLYAFKDWLMAGCDKNNYEESFSDTAVLVVCRHSVWLFDHGPDPLPVRHTMAIGSGSNFATSALSLGKTAPEAVKHAIRHDVYSSGPVICLGVQEDGEPHIYHHSVDPALESTASVTW